MTPEERMMELAKLRLRLQMNSRLRLELLSAISRLFREYQEPIKDEVLSSLVFAAPDELMGEAAATYREGVKGMGWNPPPLPPRACTEDLEVGENPPPHPIPPAPRPACDDESLVNTNPPPHPIPPTPHPTCDDDWVVNTNPPPHPIPPASPKALEDDSPKSPARSVPSATRLDSKVTASRKKAARRRK